MIGTALPFLAAIAGGAGFGIYVTEPTATFETVDLRSLFLRTIAGAFMVAVAIFLAHATLSTALALPDLTAEAAARAAG